MKRDTAHEISKVGKLSRRAFMQSALATGLTVAAAEAMWTKAVRADQVKGGHLRLALAGGSTTDSLDPGTFTDTFNLMIGYSVRGNLAEVRPDGSVAPELAESFEPSNKAATWR